MALAEPRVAAWFYSTPAAARLFVVANVSSQSAPAVDSPAADSTQLPLATAKDPADELARHNETWQLLLPLK